MNSMPGYSENESNDKKDSDPLEITLKNLKESKKKISDSFDCLYYRSTINILDQKIPHYFIGYYTPKNRGESQDSFSINIINFKRDNPFAVREFANILNLIISIESISAEYVIPIPSSTKGNISMALKDLCSEVTKNNNMKYSEALIRIDSVKSSHLSQGNRPTYQD